MQAQPTVGGVDSACTVRGLGVTDALQLELEPVQLRWVIDELDELRGVYEDELHHVTQRQPAPGTGGDEEVLERTRDELRTLRMLRAQLPASGDERRVTFVGPSAVVLDIVGGTVRNVVAALSELVQGRSTGDAEWHARVHDTSAAAAAWVRTFLDCEAVELFSFDPDGG